MARNRSQAGKAAKRKGNKFERDLARFFQEWWGEGEFARTPSSGGWGQQQARAEFNACGDIVCSDDAFPFVVEAKNQEGSWSLELFLQGKETDKISKWLYQAIEETPDDKFFMLVCKRNRQKPLVLVDSRIDTHFNWLDERHPIQCFYTYFPLHSKEKYGIIITTLEQFFSINSKRFKK